MLVKSLMELFPTWPKPASVKCLKWKFSQVKILGCNFFLPGSNLLVLSGKNVSGALNNISMMKTVKLKKDYFRNVCFKYPLPSGTRVTKHERNQSLNVVCPVETFT